MKPRCWKPKPVCCANWQKNKASPSSQPFLIERRFMGRRPIFISIYKHEPLAPALSPFGGERELFSFGAGIKMHPKPLAVQRRGSRPNRHPILPPQGCFSCRRHHRDNPFPNGCGECGDGALTLYPADHTVLGVFGWQAELR